MVFSVAETKQRRKDLDTFARRRADADGWQMEEWFAMLVIKTGIREDLNAK